MTRDKLRELELLNRIRLSDGEAGEVLGVFSMMESAEEELRALDTADVEPMVHVLPLKNILREDKWSQNFPLNALLEGAPEHTEDSWQVPRLVR